MRGLVPDETRRLVGDGKHQMSDGLAHCRAMNATRTGQQHARPPGRTAEKVIDAGGERLDPFQTHRLAHEVVVHTDPESDEDIDGGHLQRQRRQILHCINRLDRVDGQSRTGLSEPLGIMVGMGFEDQDVHVAYGAFATGIETAETTGRDTIPMCH